MDTVHQPLPMPKGPSAIMIDHTLVDSVVYLASLTSQSEEIDPMLDSMRYITARWDQTTPLAPEDRAELQQLVSELKDYLINRDPLREFTIQSLDARLQANLLHTVAVPQTQRPLGFAAVVVASVGVALGTFIIPVTLTTRMRALLTVPAFLLVSIIGTVWFYLSSLANFKPELKRVFILLCASTVLLGVFFTHFVVVQLLNWDDKPLVRYGGFLLIATLAVLAMYEALRMYAGILVQQTRFMSHMLLAGIGGLGVICAVLAAMVLPVREPLYFGFSLACLVLLNVLALFAAGVARVIYRNATAAYAASMRWLYIFMIGTFIGSIAYGVVLVWQGHLSGSSLSAALGLFATPPLLLLLYSGYSFKRETSR